MKKLTSTLLAGILLFGAVTLAPSCKKNKDKMLPPDIAFKTGGSYTSGDKTVGMNDTLTVGITASKTEDKDLLQRFVVTQQYDANSATTIYTESFNNDTYSKDMRIITRNVVGMEKYTYTIINRDGLTRTLTLKLTVL